MSAHKEWRVPPAYPREVREGDEVVAVCRDEETAHLVTAAPDMLAVLEDIFDLACRGDDVDAETDWDAVRAVIAKADGKP